MKNIHKKSEAGLVIILAIIIIVFFLGWLININQRECRVNKDCGSESYCGSDFSCHAYPTIQKTVVQYNFLIPSIIIGIAILIAAVILRWSQFKSEKTSNAEDFGKPKIPEESVEIVEPYYKADSKI